MNYSQFLTKTSAARKPSAIRALQKFLAAPGMISLGGGNPHPSTFPFQSIQVSLKDGKTLELKNIEKALQYSPTVNKRIFFRLRNRLDWTILSSG